MNLPALYNRLGEMADTADCPLWTIEVTDRHGNTIHNVEAIDVGGEDGSTIISFRLSGDQP